MRGVRFQTKVEDIYIFTDDFSLQRSQILEEITEKQQILQILYDCTIRVHRLLIVLSVQSVVSISFCLPENPVSPDRDNAYPSKHAHNNLFNNP